MDLAVYLATEREQIRKDWIASGSKESLDDYALSWIHDHAKEFADSHELKSVQ